MKNLGLFALFLFLFSVSTLTAQDTLYTTSGDVLVGEIQALQRNVLTFDTDYADSDFKVEWGNVAGLVSTTQLIIYTTNGQRYRGYLAYKESEKGVVLFSGEGNVDAINISDIVQISTLSSGFLDRIYISIGAGYSYSKANNVRQLSMTGKVNYRADKWRLSSGFNSIVTNQDDVEPTHRSEANIDYNRDILGNAFAFAGMEFLKSSEQNLDLRTTSKLGMGYYFVRKNGLMFQGGIGMANANETYGAPDNKTENSFEGLGALEFDAYDIGDFSFRAKFTAFPSFSNKGRVRLNSDVSLKYDLPLDFYIKASVVHNFDSKPLVEDVDKTDYVFQTSIGWEWD